MNRPTSTPPIKNLELKVGVLLVSTVLLAAGFVLYSLYARGAFHRTQSLTLIAPEAEGVSIGMPMTFSGFPIGEVKRMELGEDGKVRLEIAIPTKDARWLRENSVFTLEKSLVGGAKIKAHTANLADKPLAAGAARTLITGDATQEIPVLIERVKTILNNVADMTGKESHINQTLANIQNVTGRMTGEYGVMEGVLGGPEKAHQVVAALEKANTLLASLNGVSLKVDGVLAKTDSRVFGPEGVMDQAHQSIAKVNGILGDARESLKKADALLANAQSASADLPKITGNVRAATADMTQLRTEIDDSVRKVNHLINEMNKKWPFAREVEITTP
ncbi:MAG: MlaD family protein [Pseudomonadota bacterium]|nr:MlaD family protein [Pseudomonadota bacterium]